MTKIAIYTRDEAGLVSRDVQEWASEAEVLEYFGVDASVETERLLGWPETSVQWHGNVGFGR